MSVHWEAVPKRAGVADYRSFRNFRLFWASRKKDSVISFRDDERVRVAESRKSAVPSVPATHAEIFNQ